MPRMGGTHLHVLRALPASTPKHVYFGMIRGIVCQSCLTQVLHKRCGASWLDLRDKDRLVERCRSCKLVPRLKRRQNGSCAMLDSLE